VTSSWFSYPHWYFGTLGDNVSLKYT